MEILILSALLIWISVIAIHFIRSNTIKFFHFSFSPKHYYILMSCFLIWLVSEMLRLHSLTPLLYFSLFGIMGMLGETFFSFWWHLFYEKRFWMYTEKPIFHRYTSFLNFIPWAVGGILGMKLISLTIKKGALLAFFSNPQNYLNIAILFLSCTIVQLAVLLYLRRNNIDKKFQKVTVLNYSFFFFPFLCFLCYGLAVAGGLFLFLTILFAIVLTFTEYCYGKACQLYITKKLWTYTYVSFDNGHFTPLAIPGFIYAGYGIVLLVGILSVIAPLSTLL